VLLRAETTRPYGFAIRDADQILATHRSSDGSNHIDRKEHAVNLRLVHAIICSGLLFAGCASSKNRTGRASGAGSQEWRTDQPAPPRALPQAEAGGTTLTAKFAGFSRKTAKTTIDSTQPEPEYKSLPELLDTLYDDADMAEWADEDGIVRGADSDRMPEEKRNVRVQAWLYAVKYEDDKDFHIIIGTRPGDQPNMFLNVEVSGLPATTSTGFDALKQVRQVLFDILGRWPTDNRYYKPPTPIAVEVQGSLFWDIEHPPGAVGPVSSRPQTSWEIHPVSDLQQGHD
jgi:hypothetical protein